MRSHRLETQLYDGRTRKAGHVDNRRPNRQLAVGHLVPKELTEMLQGVVVLAVAVSTVWVKRRSEATK